MTLSSSSPEPFFSVISEEQLIESIAKILTEISLENAQILDRKLTPFDSKAVPSISIKEYLKRLMKFTYCCQETLIISLVYLDRMFKSNAGIYPTESNFHRSFLPYLYYLNLISKVFIDVTYSRH